MILSAPVMMGMMAPSVNFRTCWTVVEMGMSPPLESVLVPSGGLVWIAVFARIIIMASIVMFIVQLKGLVARTGIVI